MLSVVHPVLEPWAAETAALLYAGDNSVLSHESAAAVWGITAIPSFVAITLVGRKVESQPGLRLHRVKALDIRDATVHHGFPVTSPARTLIDCAGRGGIEDMLNEARAQRLVSDEAIHAAMERCPGRAGTGPLRRLLADEQETGYTQSRAERLLKQLIKAAELERASHNVYIEGKRVDAVWPRHKVVVEVDGHQWHGHRRAFERDRARDQKLIAAGYVVLRFTWNQLTQRPFAVVARLAGALAKRS